MSLLFIKFVFVKVFLEILSLLVYTIFNLIEMQNT